MANANRYRVSSRLPISERMFDPGSVTPGPTEYLDTAQFESEHTRTPKQEVLNECWPPGDMARRIKPASPDRFVKVIVRVEFEHDGWTEIAGTAQRWWRNHVCISVGDPRLRTMYVWLDAADVRRAPVDNEPPAAPEPGIL
jgi:hypothetical protein